MNVSAIVFESPGVVHIREVEVPAPLRGEVVVKTAFSAVSPGTEVRCLHGLQVGSNWPFIPGYSLSGTIWAVGEGVDVEVGAEVFCCGTEYASVHRMWGGHVAYATLAFKSVYLADHGTNLVNLSLTHLAAIALRGVELSEVKTGDRVCVVGLGPIGQLSARIFSLWGANVVACDLREDRVKVATSAGIRSIVGSPEPSSADIVVDATGAQKALSASISAGIDKPWSGSKHRSMKLIVQGSFPSSISFSYDELFQKEATLFVPRSAEQDDIRKAVDLISSGQLILDGLNSVEPFANAPEVYEAISKDARLSAVFSW